MEGDSASARAAESLCDTSPGSLSTGAVVTAVGAASLVASLIAVARLPQPPQAMKSLYKSDYKLYKHICDELGIRCIRFAVPGSKDPSQITNPQAPPHAQEDAAMATWLLCVFFWNDDIVPPCACHRVVQPRFVKTILRRMGQPTELPRHRHCMHPTQPAVFDATELGVVLPGLQVFCLSRVPCSSPRRAPLFSFSLGPG